MNRHWFLYVLKKIQHRLPSDWFSTLLVLLLLQPLGSTTWAETTAKALAQLTFITEAYPPFNFVDHGLLIGISVDLLQEATKFESVELDMDKVKLYPWARGYQQALKGPDTVLFATTRTPARENLFKWAGPIAITRIVLLAMKEKQIKIKSPEDIKEYLVGGIRDDIGEELVLATGYPKDKFISQANANAVVNMLVKQRMDMWAYGEYVAKWFIRQRRLNSNDFESVFLLKEGQLYFAFSKDVRDELIELLQQGIDKVKKSPGSMGKTLYDDILMRYL